MRAVVIKLDGLVLYQNYYPNSIAHLYSYSDEGVGITHFLGVEMTTTVQSAYTLVWW